MSFSLQIDDEDDDVPEEDDLDEVEDLDEDDLDFDPDEDGDQETWQVRRNAAA